MVDGIVRICNAQEACGLQQLFRDWRAESWPHAQKSYEKTGEKNKYYFNESQSGWKKGLVWYQGPEGFAVPGLEIVLPHGISGMSGHLSLLFNNPTILL